MQITHAQAALSISQPAAAKTAAAAAVTPGASSSSAAGSAAATPLFIGGLVNWSSLMTPDTLSALFALDQNGQVQFEGGAAPKLKEGQEVDTPAEQLLYNRVTMEHLEAIGVDLSYKPNISDEQKAFFHKVTGYNLVVNGPIYGVYDDDGKMVPMGEGLASPAWQLAGDMTGASINAGGEAASPDGNWFRQWTEKMTTAGVHLPTEWAAKAAEFFDNELDELFAANAGARKESEPASRRGLTGYHVARTPTS